MQQVVFNVPVKTFMGSDSFGRIGEEALHYGSRALIMTSSNVAESGIHKRLEKILESRGVSSIIFDSIGPDSASEVVDSAVSLASAGKAQLVVGLGGVKTISAARTVALLARSNLRVDDFIDGMKPTGLPLAFLGVPTACRDPFIFRDSVMLTDRRNRKCLLKSTSGDYPAAVFIDPETAVTIPSSTFTFTIMDTLMYAIEGYKHKEIAEMLNINQNTSKSQYSRAKEKIRQKLESISKIKEKNELQK